MSKQTRKRSLGLTALAAAVAAASGPVSAATYTVENLDSSGPGSLADAISQANSNEGPDTIRFDVRGTISLGSDTLPAITDPVNIAGPGAAGLRIVAGTTETPVFRADMNFGEYNTTISGLTITGARFGAIAAYYDEGSELFLRDIVLANNGDADEPAVTPSLVIYNGGQVRMTNSQVKNNFSYSEAAIGVYEGGFLEIGNSTISGNESLGGVPAISVDSAGAAIIGSTVSNNETKYYGGGAIGVFDGAELVIIDSNLTGNDAASDGGAILSFYADDIFIVDSTLSGNTAADDGGAIYAEGADVQIYNSEFLNNRAAAYGESSGRGGAIAIYNTFMLVDAGFKYDNGSSVFRGNSADFGGAISAGDSFVSAKYAAFTSNRAEAAGGAIEGYNGAYIELEGSTVTGNLVTGAEAYGGGGIAMYDGGPLILDNSVLSNNSAKGAGGGIYSSNSAPMGLIATQITGNSASGQGGGVFADDPSLFSAKYSQISGNTAPEGGGLLLATDEVFVKYSTIANNRSTAGAAVSITGNSQGSFMLVDRSTISGNVGSGAPGVVFQTDEWYGQLYLENSTLSGNRGNTFPAAISMAGFAYAGLDHISVVNNVGGLGAAQLHWAGDDSTTETTGSYGFIANSVFSSNMDDEVIVGGTDLSAENGYGADEFVSVSLTGTANIMEQGFGYVVEAGEGSISGDAPLEVDPELGPLAANGGLTLTHAPGPESPVIDAAGEGSRPCCAPETDMGSGEDQRGVGEQGAAADLGAVEFTENRPPRLIASLSTRLAGVVGREIPPFQVAAAFTDPDGDGIIVEDVEGLPVGLEYDDLTGTISGELEAAGTYQVLVVVRDDADPSLTILEQFTVRVLETAPVADDDDDDDFLGSSSMAFFGLMAAMGWLRRRKRV